MKKRKTKESSAPGQGVAAEGVVAGLEAGESLEAGFGRVWRENEALRGLLAGGGAAAGRNGGEVAASVAAGIPLADPEGKHYQPRHLDIGGLTSRQAMGLARLRTGLDAAAKRLECGRVVQTSADAIRWLLEWVEPIGGGKEKRARKNTKDTEK